MEVGDEQKSEDMPKKLSQCWQVGEGQHSNLLCFPTWRWEMSKKVKKWIKSWPSTAKLVKTDFPTFSLFLHGGGR